MKTIALAAALAVAAIAAPAFAQDQHKDHAPAAAAPAAGKLSVETTPIGDIITFGKLRCKVMRHHDRGIGVQFIDIPDPEALRRYFG